MKKKLSALLGMGLAFSMLCTACGGGGSASSGSSSAGSGSSSSGSSSSASSSADTKGSESSGGAGAASSGEVVKVVWANYGSSKMPLAKGDMEAVDNIEKATGGSLDIEYSPDGVLGGEADMMQQVMDGTIQIITGTTSIFSAYTDLFDVFQLPFLLGDYELEYQALRSDEAKAIFDKVGEELGVKVIGIGENGIRHFANNIHPINTVEDLKGLKLRIVPNNMLKEVMENLGANPMAVNYGEVYSSLQNKVIDGAEINITSIYAMSFYEQLKYVSEIGMYPFPGVVVCNLAWWNSLTDEQRKAIEDAEEISGDKIFHQYLPEYEVEAVEAIKAAGVEFNTVEDAERDKFVEIAKTTWQTYYDKDPLLAAFIDKVSEMSGQ